MTVAASIVLCLLAVAAHDVGAWLATRPVRAWSVAIDWTVPRHLTYEDGP